MLPNGSNDLNLVHLPLTPFCKKIFAIKDQ